MVSSNKTRHAMMPHCKWRNWWKGHCFFWILPAPILRTPQDVSYLYIVNFGCEVSFIVLFPIAEYICQIYPGDWKKKTPNYLKLLPSRGRNYSLFLLLNMGFFLWAIRCSRSGGYQLQASVSRGVELDSQRELFHHHVNKSGIAC